MIFKYLLLLIFVLTLTRCSDSFYRKDNVIHYVKKKRYDLETVVLKDYVFQSVLSPGLIRTNHVDDLRQDSVFNIFTNALKKTDLNVSIDSINTNKVDKEFTDNIYMKYRKINLDKIFQMAENNEDRVVMVPIMSINSYYTGSTSVAASSDAFSHSKIYNTILSLTVFLIKNREIIYFKSIHSGISEKVKDYEQENRAKLPVDLWNKLVKAVLKDYIERVK